MFLISYCGFFLHFPSLRTFWVNCQSTTFRLTDGRAYNCTAQPIIRGWWIMGSDQITETPRRHKSTARTWSPLGGVIWLLKECIRGTFDWRIDLHGHTFAGPFFRLPSPPSRPGCFSTTREQSSTLRRKPRGDNVGGKLVTQPIPPQHSRNSQPDPPPRITGLVNTIITIIWHHSQSLNKPELVTPIKIEIRWKWWLGFKNSAHENLDQNILKKSKKAKAGIYLREERP